MTEADGRTARAERTRALIVDAHLALIADGELKPTARQVTERAGVSPRTLWDHFADMEAVMAASSRRQLEGQDADAVPIDPGQPLARRLADYARHRAGVLEALAPLARAADVQRPFSPVLQQNLRGNLARIRAEAERVFAPELDRFAPAARERAVLALTVAADWASWQLLRQYLDRPVAEATAVLQSAIAGILSETGTASPEATGPDPATPDPPKGNPA
ncbi:TetR/AcrR family transcriptional regulator [Arthrobacter sp. JSM 101049]|uniref:TetR/AcrR family transcriptional regulator n=1 Tax=Arthrobacter sp. JSM 101049 TaxID=929097 RepID=UPI003565058D